jgi:putative ABC transport system ATP-binding protein
VNELLGFTISAYESPEQIAGVVKAAHAAGCPMTTNPLLSLPMSPQGISTQKQGTRLLEMLEGLHAEGRTTVMVTHSRENAERAKKVIEIRDGEVVMKCGCCRQDTGCPLKGHSAH